MRRFLIVLAVLSPIAAGAQTVTRGVHAWRAQAPGASGEATRSMLVGATTDLASLDVRAVTLAPRRAADRIGRHEGTELLLIVKDGALTVALGGQTRTLSPGSVALALPGDEPVVTNAGDRVASYYVFTYHAKTAPDPERGRSAGGSAMVEWADMKATPTDVGARRQPFDRATTMFKRLEMHVSTLNHGLTNHPVHDHRAEECVVMIRGDVRMVIGTGKQAATVGDIIFLPSMLPHSLDNIGAGSAEYFAFQWQ